MTLLAAAVRIGITGELYVAPVGTAAPTNTTSALNAAFKGLGYVDEDGIEELPDDTVERIRAWQNATVVRATTTESSLQLKCRLIETKGEVLKVYHKGSTVDIVSAGHWKIDVKGAQSDPRA